MDTVSSIAMTPAPARTKTRVGLDYRPALLGSAGIARSVRELARELAVSEDIEPRLFGHSLARCRRMDPPVGGLRRLPIPGRALPWLSRLGLGADRLLGGVDVFHWTDYIYPPVSSARTVVSIHDMSFADDPSFHGGGSRVLFDRARRAIEGADHVICPTEATRRAVHAHVDASADSVSVIPFGADHVTRTTVGPPPLDGQPYLLSIGTIEPRKNHARLLAAWRALPAPRPTLVVLGAPGWESAAVQHDLERAARDSNLVWLRDADDTTALTYLAHASLLVYPSLYEGFGFPPLEAIALGTPAVVGDTPAVREVCADAVTYCDPLEVESIEAAILDALAGRPDRDAMARRAARFTWSECAAQHAAVYAKVAS